MSAPGSEPGLKITTIGVFSEAKLATFSKSTVGELMYISPIESLMKFLVALMTRSDLKDFTSSKCWNLESPLP